MKTITKLIALVLLPGFMMVSCSDDDSSSNNTNSGGEYLTAKIDGESFEAAAQYDAIAATASSGALIVQGTNEQGHGIQMTIMSYDGAGTYELSDILQGQLLYTIASPFTSYSSAAGGGANGSCEITAVNETSIEGTFSFTGRKAVEGATEMVTVTEGKFKANFQ